MSAGGKEVGRISVRVVPDLDDFRSKIVRVCEEIEKAVKVKIEVVPDMDGFREKIRAATSGLGNAKVDVDVDVDGAGAKAHLAALIAEMKAQAARSNIKVDVGADRNVLSSGAASAASAADSAGQSFMGLSRMGWIVAAVFSAAAPAIGLVAGLLAGLPSLLTAIVAPVGAVALGLDGIIKAADAAGIISVGKKGKQGPGGIIKELQSSVSGVFQTGLTPVFEQLTQMLPMLKSGLGEVAQGVVNMAQGFANLMTAPAVMQQLQSTFSNIGGFLSQITPSLTSFAQTFITLGQIGSANFGKLVAPLQTFAMQFEQMINKVSASGVLDKAFTGLSETLGSVLNLFTRLFESGLQSMGQLGGPIANMVDGLGNALIAMMPALTSLSGLIGNVLGALGNTLAPVITALTPAFTEFSNVLSTMIASNLQALAPVLTQVASALGTTMLTAIQALEPMLPSLLASFQQLATVVAGELGQYLPQLAVAFGQLAGVALQNAPVLLQLLADAFYQLLPVLPTLLPQVVQIAEALANMAVSVGPLLPAMIGLGVAAIQLAVGLGGPLIGAISVLVTAFDNVNGAIERFASTAITKGGEVLTFFTELPGKIISALGSVDLSGAGQAIMNSLLGGIRAGLNSVLSFVDTIAGEIAKHKGPLPYDRTVLTPNGQALMEGLQDGLEGGLQGVLSRAKLIAQQISDAIKSGGPIDSKGLKRSLDEIDLERKQLKVEYDQTADKGKKAELKDQMKQLQTVRDELSLQSEQLGFSKKHGEDGNQNQLGQSVSKMVDIAKNLGQANLSQFENDIGISGQGAVSQIADQGITFLTGMLSKLVTGGMGGGGTTINVGSVDDAMTIKQREANKAALQWKDR